MIAHKASWLTLSNAFLKSMKIRYNSPSWISVKLWTVYFNWKVLRKLRFYWQDLYGHCHQKRRAWWFRLAMQQMRRTRLSTKRHVFRLNQGQLLGYFRLIVFWAFQVCQVDAADVVRCNRKTISMFESL